MVAQRRKIDSVTRSNRQRRWRGWAVLLASAALTACAVPSPYQKPPPTQPPPPETPPAETRPGEPPSTIPEPTPAPAPVVRGQTLGAASRALVSQAAAQIGE